MTRLRDVLPWGGSEDEDRPIAPEEFELELLELGLSGRCFGFEEYAEALGRRLGIDVTVQLMNEVHYPAFLRHLVLSGRLAEMGYDADRKRATIVVPSTLPPYVMTVTVLHELGHLAAGDHLVGGAKGKRLARRPPSARQASRERDADLRAVYALIAGTLGPKNPYSRSVYEVV